MLTHLNNEAFPSNLFLLCRACWSPLDLQPVVYALAGSWLLFPSHKGQRCLFFSHLSCITKGICQPLHNGRICRFLCRPFWRQPCPQYRAAVAGRLLMTAGWCMLLSTRRCILIVHDAAWLMLVTHRLVFAFLLPPAPPPPPWKGRCGIMCFGCVSYLGEQNDEKAFGGLFAF